MRADNGTIEGVQTLLGQEPRAIAVDAAGNVFYSGGVGYYVYRRDAITGTAAVYAGNGNGQYGGDGGQATGAMIQGVEDLAFDSAGNLFIADSENHRIRRIDAATGIITTYAGNGQPSGALGDGGLATAASLNRPSIIRFDAAGNLIIVDRLHHRVRKVDPTTRVITTIAEQWRRQRFDHRKRRTGNSRRSRNVAGDCDRSDRKCFHRSRGHTAQGGRGHRHHRCRPGATGRAGHAGRHRRSNNHWTWSLIRTDGCTWATEFPKSSSESPMFR